MAVTNPALANKELTAYFDQLDKGDTSIPSNDVLTTISKKLDEAAQKSFKKLYDVSISDPLLVQKEAELTKAPRLAKKYSKNKIILKDITPFEQFLVLNSYLSNNQINKQHTYFFAKEDDDYIPVRVKTGSLMHTILGTTKGDHKAPDYKDWASKNPREDLSQKRFIYPLEGLEMVRQPNFIAATVLKGNFFETDFIDEKWRYGLEFACVENGNQSKNSPKKTRSAALNLCKFVDKFSDPTDVLTEEYNVSAPLFYEWYSEEGYKDERQLGVTSGNVLKAVKKALLSQNDRELDNLMLRLTIAKIDPPKSKSLKSLVVKELFND